MLATPPIAATGPAHSGGIAVPWHHQGEAERLVAGIWADDRDVALLAREIAERIQARKARRPGRAYIRREWLPDVVREWRTRLATPGRLAFNVEQDRHGITILDCRLSANRFRFKEWPEAEIGLLIVTVRYRLATDDLGCQTHVLAAVSKHAIARHHQRTGGAGVDILTDDLRRLALEHPRLVEQPTFRCPVPSGFWVGDALGVEAAGANRRVLAVRTFKGIIRP